MSVLSEDLFNTIWENDVGLGNIIVDSYSNKTIFDFVKKWETDVINEGNKEAAEDLKTSVCICPEVSCFTQIEGSIPLTFAHCVIRNNVVYHKNIFEKYNIDISGLKDGSVKYNNQSDNTFLKCLESAALIPIANSINSSADIIYSANNWIFSFRKAINFLINGLVESGEYDEDVRLIIPVIGMEFAYLKHEEILKIIKETGLEDRVTYVVAAEISSLWYSVYSSVLEKINIDDEAIENAQYITGRIVHDTFSHRITE